MSNLRPSTDARPCTELRRTPRQSAPRATHSPSESRTADTSTDVGRPTPNGAIRGSIILTVYGPGNQVRNHGGTSVNDAEIGRRNERNNSSVRGISGGVLTARTRRAPNDPFHSTPFGHVARSTSPPSSSAYRPGAWARRNQSDRSPARRLCPQRFEPSGSTTGRLS